VTLAARLAEIASRQHELAAEQSRLAEEAAALLAQLANGDGAAGVVAADHEPEPSSLESLSQAAAELGIPYNTLRMRASRAKATVHAADRAFVWRQWLEDQKKTSVRTVRSLSAQCAQVISLAGKDRE
jgi:septal ring factor EnvC (AmiA/AmiB activator)